jgi:hypothetical protein
MSKSAVARGGTVFGAVLMIVVGAWQTLMGIAALVRGEYFASGAGYAYEFDTTGWGWVHLIIGVAAVFVGLMLFTGTDWARMCGLALAFFSLISNFLWLPIEPWWSLVIIAADVFIIWSLLNVGERLRFPEARND